MHTMFMYVILRLALVYFIVVKGSAFLYSSVARDRTTSPSQATVKVRCSSSSEQRLECQPVL